MSQKASTVKVYDIETHELIREDAPYTEAKVKAIINKGIPHKNSIAELIKHNPELLALYHKNRMQYMEDIQVLDTQLFKDYTLYKARDYE